jgi:hypothetical protein
LKKGNDQGDVCGKLRIVRGCLKKRKDKLIHNGG